MKQIETDYGLFNVLSNDDFVLNTDVIDNYLSEYIDTASTIITIGSKNGMLELYLVKKKPSVNIYTFEPRDIYYNLVKSNLILNKTDNIIIINNMLGHLDGNIKVNPKIIEYDYDEIYELGKGTILTINDDYTSITLDSLGLISCDIIYIDIDCAYLTLIGGFATIKKLQPIICFRSSNDEVMKFFGNHNIFMLIQKIKYEIFYTSDDMIFIRPSTQSC